MNFRQICPCCNTEKERQLLRQGTPAHSTEMATEMADDNMATFYPSISTGLFQLHPDHYDFLSADSFRRYTAKQKTMMLSNRCNTIHPDSCLIAE
ncbi:hypothetical protein IQ268_10915 [Oculatella sp. LEGE 06141]|uniref:hypothetical protein n=1 Tax=Oculatella sp. LEGE 06141 TaxID=1828648 RepID=UPI00187E6441|nr:hypothetical protein [Oculatella sp. LEGE 06141]MBE9179072.1 hypothetical protein [Oculatella sp. LEGE 06141]